MRSTLSKFEQQPIKFADEARGTDHGSITLWLTAEQMAAHEPQERMLLVAIERAQGFAGKGMDVDRPWWRVLVGTPAAEAMRAFFRRGREPRKSNWAHPGRKAS